MDDLLNINSAKTMARFISVCFLVIHVALCVLFWKTGVTPMAIFNVGSVIFYVLSLALINKGYLALWTDLVYLEVVAHMVCAALLCGWDSDFQTAILAVSSLTFFSEYVCRCLNINYAHGLPLCVFGAVAYLVTCAVCALRPAPYTLPDSASLLLKPVWGIIVFSVLIVVLKAFAVEATRPHKALTDRMNHDKLTGLPNRYYVAEYLDKLFKSDDPRRSWLAIADLDDFKTVNDTYGHNCGDLVLSTIASPLDNNLGRTLACRWGGEEFLLVGPIDQDMESQRKQLERVRRVIADQPIWYEEHLINVTITMGLAACQEGYTVKERIKVADEKPYEGKTHGKNQIVM